VSALVAEPAAAGAIARKIAGAPLVAFDLEFLSQDRLVPTLCLVQVAWLELPNLDVATETIVAASPEVRLVDALAVDVRPVLAALAEHPCVVAHAARQDLGIVAAQFGLTIAGLVDTQVMAAFAGLGDQVGLGTLTQELLGLRLAKDSQWTDWARRPLAAAQLAYADADVRHLPALYARLVARLGERLAWARAETAAVTAEAVAAASITPENAWQYLGGLRGLDAEALAALQQLAAWRYRLARELDRPIGWVLNERVLVDLARVRPRSVEAVRSTKGVSPLARQRAGEIMAALAQARPEEVTPIPAARAPSTRAQRWSDVLVAIAQLAAEQAGVAVRLLATRGDAEELARAVDERGLAAASALPALATWRREVLGELWLGWLAGRLTLVGDTTSSLGFALLPRDRDD
jgi:ribonuclease D